MQRTLETDLRINPVFSFFSPGAPGGGPAWAGLVLENLTADEGVSAGAAADRNGLRLEEMPGGASSTLHLLSGRGEDFEGFTGPAGEDREDVFGAVARAMRNRQSFESEIYHIAPGVEVSLANPQVWGILNVTPDSFSDAGRFATFERAFAQAEIMAAQGASVIDVGGESTRPGAEPVGADEECRRVLPVIEAVVGRLGIPVSIDTSKSSVAARAIEAGATIVNDVTCLRDPEMAAVVSSAGAGAVLMHMLGEPRTMQVDPRYANLFGDIARRLRAGLAALDEAGGAPALIDPGIGFGKTLDHNLRLIGGAEALGSLGRPVLTGPSRKSFLGMILDLPVQDRLEGTASATACAVLAGSSVLRVHDVLQMKRVVKVAAAVRRSRRVLP